MPLIMRGNWTVSVKEKNAAFAQRFIISGATQGTGTYNAPHAPVEVKGDVWSLRIQAKPTGSSAWADSEYQITFPVASGGAHHFDVQSNDVWPGDKDFDDLVLTLSAPITETDFLVYGSASLYSGCAMNPCYPGFVLVETWEALERAMRIDALREIIEKYKERVPFRLPIPIPDPPPEGLPVEMLRGETFRPLLLAVQGDTRLPAKKARVLRTVVEERQVLKKKKLATELVERRIPVRTVELPTSYSREYSAVDMAVLGKFHDLARKLCYVEPLVNVPLRFVEYDRTESELAGGAYTGEGNREDLGQASTDRNGNYIFRFSRKITEFIAESNTDVPLGADETLEAMPDIVVQALGGTSPDMCVHETAPYWNVPVLKRIDLCIPSSKWPTPVTTECHGRPISHIGFIPVGKSTVTLDAEGRVTCADTSKIDIPQTHCAAWWSKLRMSACIGRYDTTKHYTIEHCARKPDGSWTAWCVYQEPLLLDNWNTTLSTWVAKKVGPFTQNLELHRGATKVDVLAYNNVQGDMDWSGPDWFVKAVIPSWMYSYQGQPGSAMFRLKAYGADGKQIPLWNDPATGATKYEDVITLFIDHTGPELDFKDVTIGTQEANLCPLFTVPEAELESATLDLEFKTVQRQGFLASYALALTKCNTPSFAVENVGSAHPIAEPPSGSAGPCQMWGTMLGVDANADADDFVPVSLNPTGAATWLSTGEELSSFTLNLYASVKRTDGHSGYPSYGPKQHNFVVRRGS